MTLTTYNIEARQSTTHHTLDLSPISTSHRTHIHLVEKSSHNSTQHRIRRKGINPLYNTHIHPPTSLDRNPHHPPSPNTTSNKKVPSQRERKEEESRKKKLKRLRCNAFIQRKTRAGRTCRFVFPNTKEGAVMHARRKKNITPNICPRFFTRPSLALDICVVPGGDGGQGSSIPLDHRVGETFSARFALGWAGRRLWWAWGVSARCRRKTGASRRRQCRR